MEVLSCHLLLAHFEAEVFLCSLVHPLHAIFIRFRLLTYIFSTFYLFYVPLFLLLYT